MLPLGPTGYGDSPYQLFTACAGNPLLISLDVLIEEGLLAESEASGAHRFVPGNVDYESVIAHRRAVWPLSTPDWEFIRAVLASVADTAIIPAQDVLGLGGEARMNQPGAASGNCRWQLHPGQFTANLARRLGVLTETYERV